MLSPKNLAFLSVGGNFEFLGENPPPLFPLLNTPGDKLSLFHVSSYLHAEWATAEKLMQLDKRVQMKIKRFFVKRNAMPFPDEVCVLLPTCYFLSKPIFYVFLCVCMH